MRCNLVGNGDGRDRWICREAGAGRSEHTIMSVEIGSARTPHVLKIAHVRELCVAKCAIYSSDHLHDGECNFFASACNQSVTDIGMPLESIDTNGVFPRGRQDLIR